MAIQIVQPATFSWPVKVQIPRDGGGYEAATFDATFKRLTRSEAEEMGGKVFSGELSGVDAVRSILVGWAGVMAGDEPIPFSEMNRERLLDIPGAAVAIFGAFTDAMDGKARAKN